MPEMIGGLPTRGSAAQDVVGGIKAEIAAEPKLVAAQPEMKVVAAGSADPVGETGAVGAVPAAKAVAHRSASGAYTADPRAQAGVAKTPSTGTQAAMTKAAAEAAAKACIAKAPATEGHSPAAAHTAAANTAAACCLSRGRNRQSEGKPRHCRQNESVHHYILRSTRLGARGKERCFIWGVRARIGERPRHFVADLGKNEQKTALAMGRRSC